MATNNALELSVQALLVARVEAITGLQCYQDLIPVDSGSGTVPVPYPGVLPAVRFSTLDSHIARAAANPSISILWHFDMLWCVTFQSDTITLAMQNQVALLRSALDAYTINDNVTFNANIYSVLETSPWRQTQVIDNEYFRSFGGEYHVVAKEGE